MIECKFCRRFIKEKNVFCPFCGYDPRIDTVNPSFEPKKTIDVEKVRKMLRQKRYARTGISPGVKKFALIGLGVVIFSIFYKHNFSLEGVISEFKQARLKAGRETGKPVPLEAEAKEKKIEEPETFNPSTPLIVQGLAWGEAKPQAIINNKVFTIGDVIEGAEVIEISKEGVTLLYKNRRYTLPSSVSIYEHGQLGE